LFKKVLEAKNADANGGDDDKSKVSLVKKSKEDNKKKTDKL